MMSKRDFVLMKSSAEAIAMALLLTTSAVAAVPSSEYSHPHEAINVAPSRNLNLFCLGQGKPTVVFEAGFGSTSMAWHRVQDAVGTFTRACAYDRAGFGFSDPATRASDARNTVEDLHHLVEAAALGGSLVLVGHSMGGLYATLYAETYPDDVSGLVLVDPHFPEYERQAHAVGTPAASLALRKGAADSIALLQGCLTSARTGELSRPQMQASPCLMTFPPLDPVLTREWHREAAGVPYEAANLSEAQSTAPKDADDSSLDDDELPQRPKNLHHVGIQVLIENPDHPYPGMSASDLATELRLERQDARALAEVSVRGSWASVSHAGHNIQEDAPDAIIAAVRDAVQAERNHSGPP